MANLCRQQQRGMFRCACEVPELRWEGGVDQDMIILGVKNWKKVALNIDEWAKLFKKARAHQGLSSQ